MLRLLKEGVNQFKDCFDLAVLQAMDARVWENGAQRVGLIPPRITRKESARSLFKYYVLQRVNDGRKKRLQV